MNFAALVLCLDFEWILSVCARFVAGVKLQVGPIGLTIFSDKHAVRESGTLNDMLDLVRHRAESRNVAVELVMRVDEDMASWAAAADILDWARRRTLGINLDVLEREVREERFQTRDIVLRERVC